MILSIFSRQGNPEKPLEDFISGTLSPPGLYLADGVSRTPKGVYPRPSPAAIAARIGASTARAAITAGLTHGAPVNHGRLLAQAFSLANDSIRAYVSTFAALDFRHNDLPGTVLTVAYIWESHLYYGHIGDSCIIGHYRDGHLYRFSSIQTQGVDWWATHQKRFHGIHDRLEFSRTHMRNHKEARYSYGVLTGEEEALKFVEYGRAKLNNLKQLLLISDGLSKAFQRWMSCASTRNQLREWLNAHNLGELMRAARTEDHHEGRRKDDASIGLITL